MIELKDINIPDDIKYAEDHEWVSVEAPFRIGVSDFAQDALGDLTYVELPEVGMKLTKGEEFGTLESTKSVSPLYSPLSGEVTAVNDLLEDEPGQVNSDPYGEGWIIEIAPANLDELDELLDAAAYQEKLEQEE
ncbi:MAG: glycine cleavage system protein GcvH [Desulfovibrionaceae bacterium]|nr:glycine cleavage system protein GcvH [Desulfovibrionaceae bacterium]